MNQIVDPNTKQGDEFSHNFEEYGDYLYFERNTKEKPSCYENILGIAQKRIVIIDPFFSEDEDPQLFEQVKKEGIDIKILSICKDGKDDKNVKALYDSIKNKLKKNITAFNLCVHCFKTKPKRRVRTGMTTYDFEPIYTWHDRYLLVDDRAFLIGSSMNNSVSGEKSFGIYEVKDDGKMVQFILDLYRQYVDLHVNWKTGWCFSTK